MAQFALGRTKGLPNLRVAEAMRWLAHRLQVNPYLDIEARYALLERSRHGTETNSRDLADRFAAWTVVERLLRNKGELERTLSGQRRIRVPDDRVSIESLEAVNRCSPQVWDLAPSIIALLHLYDLHRGLPQSRQKRLERFATWMERTVRDAGGLQPIEVMCAIETLIGAGRTGTGVCKFGRVEKDPLRYLINAAWDLDWISLVGRSEAGTAEWHGRPRRTVFLTLDTSLATAVEDLRLAAVVDSGAHRFGGFRLSRDHLRQLSSVRDESIVDGIETLLQQNSRAALQRAANTPSRSLQQEIEHEESLYQRATELLAEVLPGHFPSTSAALKQGTH
ncbi:hypothetical protein ACFV5G_10180 [Streptomyces sp. NPDC059766]|uniref:hypothetical protein n=1 Tax=Streptomyces sp. NPDC059766 TaxID=3346940 RepID=UPI0036573441